MSVSGAKRMRPKAGRNVTGATLPARLGVFERSEVCPIERDECAAVRRGGRLWAP
jgi:hypothetical protein